MHLVSAEHLISAEMRDYQQSETHHFKPSWASREDPGPQGHTNGVFTVAAQAPQLHGEWSPKSLSIMNGNC